MGSGKRKRGVGECRTKVRGGGVENESDGWGSGEPDRGIRAVENES